jgi:hypothetical protein
VDKQPIMVGTWYGQRRAIMMGMQRGSGRTMLVFVGLILLLVVGWWLVKALVKLAFLLIIAAALFGGGYYLFNKARRALQGGKLNR